MPRVKRGTMHAKHRKNILKAAKGYRLGRSNKIKLAKVAVIKAGKYAYRDRKNRKRVNRRLWSVKLNAGLRPLGTTYSKFINLLKIAKIELDRKVMSDLAENNPVIFEKFVTKVLQTAK